MCLSCRPGWRGPGPTVEQPVCLNPLYAIEKLHAVVERPGIVAAGQEAAAGTEDADPQAGSPASFAQRDSGYDLHGVTSGAPCQALVVSVVEAQSLASGMATRL